VRRNLRLSLGGLVAAIVVIAVVLGLVAIHALRSTDLSTIDARFTIRGSLGPPSDLVVVGIDPATFAYLDTHDPHQANYPFPRRLDAKVIANLAKAGAKVIAVDLQFSEQTDQTDDNDLILAVRAAHAHNVVLAATGVLKDGSADIFGGRQGITYSRATPAMAQFPFDSDGKYRRMQDRILGITTFSVAAAQLALGHAVKFPGGTDGTAYIDYRGPTGTVPEISYSSVLTG
jgi:adenylate cyclase